MIQIERVKGAENLRILYNMILSKNKRIDTNKIWFSKKSHFFQNMHLTRVSNLYIKKKFRNTLLALRESSFRFKRKIENIYSYCPVSISTPTPIFLTDQWSSIEVFLIRLYWNKVDWISSKNNKDWKRSYQHNTDTFGWNWWNNSVQINFCFINFSRKLRLPEKSSCIHQIGNFISYIVLVLIIFVLGCLVYFSQKCHFLLGKVHKNPVKETFFTVIIKFRL